MRKLIDNWAGKGSEEAIISEQDAQVWRAAADTWRLFYWDWARKQNYPQEVTPGGDSSWQDFGIPYLFSLQVVPVWDPKTQQRVSDYENPLWNFNNPEKGLDGKSLRFGTMPEDKKRYNIPDNPAKSDLNKPWDPPMPVSPPGCTTRVPLTDVVGSVYRHRPMGCAVRFRQKGI